MTRTFPHLFTFDISMDSIFHIQGPPINNASTSQPAPLFLIHAVSGFGLPYLSLGPLSPAPNKDGEKNGLSPVPDRPIYALSSPIYQYKSYRIGLSFAKLAKEYAERIRSVRPHGPYLLGGWSMGGVLSVKIAEIFQEVGEEVQQIVLIDSANPEGCPPFQDAEERDSVVQWMYSMYAPRMGLVGWDEVDNEDGEIQDQEQGDDEDEDDDNEVDISQYLPRMRAHISNSLDVIGRAGREFLGTPVQCHVSLIKCTELAPLPPTMSEPRKKAIEFRHEDNRNGWPFEQLEYVQIKTEHDRCFDTENVPIITEILRDVLGKVKR